MLEEWVWCIRRSGKTRIVLLDGGKMGKGMLGVGSEDEKRR